MPHERQLPSRSVSFPILLRTSLCQLLVLGSFLNILVEGQYLRSPCPDIFSYRLDPTLNVAFGYIELPLRIGQVNRLDVELSIGTTVPKHNLGSITLVKSQSATFWDIYQNRPAQYRVNFPFTNIYPTLLKISLNGQPICIGQRARGQIVTTINLEHTLIAQLQQQLSSARDGPRPPPQVAPVSQYPAAVQAQQTFYEPNPTSNQIDNPQPVPVQFNTRAPTFPQAIQQPQETSYNGTCGTVASFTHRLSINGIRSAKGQFPWTAPLFNTVLSTKPKYICGTTIITRRHLLTAAHCVYYENGIQRPPNHFVVVPGMYNIDSFFDEDNQLRDLSQISVHEDYFHEDSTLTDSDIAVLAVSQPIVYNDLVRPICVWRGDGNIGGIVGSTGVVSGWGYTETGDASYPSYVSAVVLGYRECTRALNYLISSQSRTFCADGKGSVPCHGDSGSGLVFNRGSQFFIRGVVSIGQRDPDTLHCEASKYVIYTDVAAFYEWIIKVLKT